MDIHLSAAKTLVTPESENNIEPVGVLDHQELNVFLKYE